MNISVIIPVKNAEKYIDECITSILNQTLGEFEVIIVDDCSSDSSLEIIKKYRDSDDRIHIIKNNKSIGPGLSRNKALNVARGKYLLFCDADDIYPKQNIFEKIYEVAKKHKPDVIIGSFSEYDEKNGRLITQWDKGTHLEDYKIFKNGVMKFEDWQCDIGWQRCAFRREFIERDNITFQSLTRHEDSVFLVKALTQAKKIYGITDIVYQYRIFHKPLTLSRKNIEDAFSGITENMIIARKKNLKKLEKWCRESLMWYASLSPEINNIRAENARQEEEITELRKQLDRKIYRAINKILKPYYYLKRKRY